MLDYISYIFFFCPTFGVQFNPRQPLFICIEIYFGEMEEAYLLMLEIIKAIPDLK